MLTQRADLDPLRLYSTFDFAERRALVAAVSGGSDSLALLFLTKSWLDRIAPGTKLVAVTVDHGLRPGSAAEAEEVAKIAARHGIAHRTMTWTGAKPTTGVPAAARMARYLLLAEAARLEGTDVILTGHTADDQAETVLMRSQRGTSDDDARGLAGMAPVTLFDGTVWIVRPLLGTRRQELRDYLRGIGESWLDDPTNINQLFERPRVRAALGSAEDGRIETALDMAAQAAEERLRLGGSAAALIRVHASLPCPGLIRLDPDFAGAETSTTVYALRILLGVVGGTPHLPDAARTEALFARLGQESFCATLSRTALDARRDGIFLRREARNLPAPLAPAGNVAWDGRFRLRVRGPLGDALVAPLGSAEAKKAGIEGVNAPASLIRAAQATLPALWRGGECLGVLTAKTEPHGVSATPIAAPWALFLPGFDLSPATTIAELILAETPPAPPLRSHIGSKA
ncbi:tRNA(Ile)-lysidine synthase [Mesorhizobium soli]|uniref:tRNA lysidine(34) synthetase TilS n=1 Tax=Pseudaminobacter soli (ex Li et al. 2025) TaxID=1295366 RepID=UPI0024767E3E|nr:tRNA lysidine(34) synthetase TilS [Mesorhizobium soli]MDH6231142.1 tRNA(Ile)-lysidine synthase [Mesorhizobium soli]